VLFRRFDPDKLGGETGPVELRRSTAPGVLGTGTLACPRCDAPVALVGGRMTPTEPLGCPYCDHYAAAREFLTLESPSRPAHVQVRVRYAGIGSSASAP
jgi:hypothetical protein